MQWKAKILVKGVLLAAVVVLILHILTGFHPFAVNSKISGYYSDPYDFHDLPDSEDLRYKIWYNVWKSTSLSNRNDVGIVTQTSINNLHYLPTLVQHWNGIASVAVFVSGDKIQEFSKNLLLLTKCYPKIANQVTIHVVMPLSHPPFDTWLNFAHNSDTVECSSLLENKVNHADNYAIEKIPYPVNLLRNVALKLIPTSHVLVVDIDILPSKDLQNILLSYLQNNDLQAIVIPTFEVKSEKFIPIDKIELIKYWNVEKLRPFYQNVCWKCQKYTDYDRWKRSTESYEVSWHDPWEPFYVAKKDFVVYDERFEQYGFNRISQLCHLHMSGFTFLVVPNAFLLHLGFKEKKRFHNTKDEEHDRNKLIYRKVKSELLEKFKQNGRHC